MCFWNKTFSFCRNCKSFSSLTEESCGQCPPGWFLVNASCYFHSKSASGAFKNWHDSRADCIARGASLTVIDNLEEQVSPVCAAGEQRQTKE